jgi:DeoR family transcriptional regulator, fructose operon transcriptional repressor
MEMAVIELAVRTHGAAVVPGRSGVTLDTREPALSFRARTAEQAKKRIAAAAAALTSPGQTVGLDVGTMALELAACLGQVGGLSVVTNSQRAGIGLTGTANRIYLIGGEVRADELSLHGSIG